MATSIRTRVLMANEHVYYHSAIDALTLSDSDHCILNIYKNKMYEYMLRNFVFHKQKDPAYANLYFIYQQIL